MTGPDSTYRRNADRHQAAARVCGCGYPIRTPLVRLCGRCAGRLERDLAEIPALVDEIDTTRLRQSRTGGQAIGGGHSSDRPLPFDDRPSKAAKALLEVLRRVAGTVVAGRQVGWPRDLLADYARFLQRHLLWLVEQDDVGQVQDDVFRAVSWVRSTIDRRADKEHWGWCGAVDYDEHDQPIVGSAPCLGVLRAPHGAARATCEVCGAVHQLDDSRKRLLLEQARDYVDGPPGLSQMFSRLVRPLPEATIRGWAAKGRLVAHGSDERGRALYRVGDVMDLLSVDAVRAGARHDRKQAG